MFPSVTQVLAPFSGLEKVKELKPDVIETASIRGTYVHDMCEKLLTSTFPIVDIEEEYKGYIESFLQFKEQIEEVCFVEKRLYHNAMGYHGKPDIYCRLKGDDGFSLWDWKTPYSSNKVWALQIAAYRKLLEVNNYPVIRQGMIRLRKDGKKPIINEYTSTYNNDFALFVSCLNVYKHFYKEQNNGL